mgnify:CR=1 FL=1
MKKITTFILVFISFSMASQELSKKKIKKLHNLNVNIEKLDFKDITIQNNLNKILTLDRKRKTNKTVAIVLTSIAASGIILGGAIYSKKGLFGEVLGATLLTSSVVYGGISIPFWTASKNRKKERDKLMKLF